MRFLVLVPILVPVIAAQAQVRLETGRTVTVPLVSAVTVSPGTVAGGATVTGTVTLAQPAGSGGVAVKFASSTRPPPRCRPERLCSRVA